MKYRLSLPVLLVLLLGACGTSQPRFAIEMVPVTAGNWEAIRYNTSTGAAWTARQGEWVPIRDLEPLPESVYAIRLVAEADGGWGAIRLDTASGRSWSADRGTWVEIRQ